MTTRQFAVPTVLRMVPNHLLHEFLTGLGHQLDPSWQALKEKEIKPILDFLDELSRPDLDLVESGLRSVSDLATETGLNAILEAASLMGIGNLGSEIPEELCIWGRTMWLWIHHKELFEKAQIIHQIDNLSWWRKRNDLPSTDPDLSAIALEQLEERIAVLLREQGRGKDCTVETLKRGDTVYFFAYPDDFVQNVIVHDADGHLAPDTFRQTLQIVFAYDKIDGSLETYAKLAKPFKEKLESIFADSILHWEIADYDPEAAYALDHLKDSSFELSTDAQDALRVRIRKIRLADKRSGRRILLEVDADDPNDSIHNAINDCLNLEQTPLSALHVTLVTFCFEFLPLDSRKPGRQSFDVGFPRSCSLRNARPERVELIQKYLKRWKIDLAKSTEESAVSVG